MAAAREWQIHLVRGADGHRFPARTVVESIDNVDAFREHLVAIARIEDRHSTDNGENWIGEWELDVRDPREPNKSERIFRWRKD